KVVCPTSATCSMVAQEQRGKEKPVGLSALNEVQCHNTSSKSASLSTTMPGGSACRPPPCNTRSCACFLQKGAIFSIGSSPSAKHSSGLPRSASLPGGSNKRPQRRDLDIGEHYVGHRPSLPRSDRGGRHHGNARYHFWVCHSGVDRRRPTGLLRGCCCVRTHSDHVDGAPVAHDQNANRFRGAAGLTRRTAAARLACVLFDVPPCSLIVRRPG